MKITVALDADAPQLYLERLSSVPGVDAVRSAAAWVEVNGTKAPLVLLPRPDRATPPGLPAGQPGSTVPPGHVGLVVADALTAGDRGALEAAGLSYLDALGAVHLEFGDVVVHIERAVPQTVAEPAPPRKRRGFGPAGVRAVQVILGSTDSEWSVTGLSDAAAVSMGTSHHVLRLLEESNFAEVVGAGTRLRRVVTQRSALLDWLARIERQRVKPVAETTFLKARDDEDLLRRFHDRAQSAEIRYAVTAGLGAKLLRIPDLSTVVRAQIRIDRTDTPHALERLGLEPVRGGDTGRAANLELWSDNGRLGTFGSSAVGGINVAPAVRVWLDLARQSPRGEDAARLIESQARG